MPSTTASSSPGSTCATSACVVAGAPDLAHNADRELAPDAEGRGAGALREALELVEDTRRRLLLNVSEDMALEALSFRLQRVLAR